MLGLVRSAAEDDPQLKRKAEFMARHRRDYGYGGRLDRLRSTHFSRLRGTPPPRASPCSASCTPCCGRSHGRHTAEVQGRCIWTTPEPRYTRSSSCEQSQSTSRRPSTAILVRHPHLLSWQERCKTKMRCRSRLLLAHDRPPNHGVWCVCVRVRGERRQPEPE